VFTTGTCSGSRPFDEGDVVSLDRWWGALELENIGHDDPRLRPPQFSSATAAPKPKGRHWAWWLLAGAGALLAGVLALRMIRRPSSAE